jgi:4-hydroxy-4-methyl-2-oxoglutarate aldolase
VPLMLFSLIGNVSSVASTRPISRDPTWHQALPPNVSLLHRSQRACSIDPLQIPGRGTAVNDLEILEALKQVDSPTITNVVATYPDAKTCLGLYNPWTENWYTDQTIKCMYPEMGPRVGYAVTCVFGLPDPNFKGRLSFLDVVDALDASPRPTILVLEQKFPPEIAGKVGLAGEIMTTTMKAMGCVGCISNGPSRDIDAIRALDFQYMLTGVSAGHGEFAVQSVNAPVSVGGMDVAPGEIIHMDENGAVKFPADKLAAVHENVKTLLEGEEAQLSRLRNASSAEEVRAIMTGGTYSPKDKK